MRWTRVVVGAAAVPAGLVAGACRLGLVRRVEVAGASMRPTLEPGDRLLVIASRRIRVGDLVALADPRTPARTLVKRVSEVNGADLTVLGDDPVASTDSRSFGPVPRQAALGRVVYRYAPSARAGLIKHTAGGRVGSPPARRTGMVPRPGRKSRQQRRKSSPGR